MKFGITTFGIVMVWASGLLAGRGIAAGYSGEYGVAAIDAMISVGALITAAYNSRRLGS
jgi:hypothetical protein